MHGAVSPDAARRFAPLVALALAASACDSARRVVGTPLPECERCHGGNGSAAPPRTATGLTATSVRGVGAHRRHLELQGDDVRAPLSCDTCHVVPTRSVDGHIDGVARVRLLDPAVAGGASGRWDPETGRCENVYCHGATLRDGSRGAATAPEWTRVDGSQVACGSCHAAPPASHGVYTDRTNCHRCHPGTVNADGTIDVASGQHIDGRTPSATACDGCHLAPPDTGAHRAHANPADPSSVAYGSLDVAVGTSPAGAPAYVFGCGFCHPLDAARHMDGSVDVTVAPEGGGLKALNAAAAAFDPATSTCSGVYCHGATLRASSRGAATAPVWTQVDGSQKTCASCHAAPPGSHALYAGPTECARCHSGTVNADGTIDVASMQHLDGTTPVPTACNACHLAPPDTGAHRAHANAPDPAALSYGSLAVDVGTSPSGAPAYVFGCGYCHPLDAAAHRDGTGEIDLAPAGAGASLKSQNAPAAAFDPATSTCSGVYCHGATLRGSSRGAATAPIWTQVDGSQKTCASCHAAPPGSHAGYPSAPSCQLCHPATVRADGTIDVAGMKHVDGQVEAPAGTGCTMCHGAPPATGAHRAHANPADPAAIAYGGLSILEDVSPSGGPSYDFGCGHCHPVDPARHAAAWPAAQVELTPPATPVAGDEIKARNDPAAAFDAATGTCTGVYCHSSGQATPAYVPSPAWTAAPGALGCGGCHGNPPRYASGGAGTPTANSHLVLADDGWESGHFQGMPGYWHTSRHGGNVAGEDAAPMTCQTCHADTVDPAAAGPSGFYWLDTTGSYQFAPDAPGADPARTNESLYGPWYARLQCTACHDGTAAPAGRGRVLPLRHVNGKREVAFDPRTSLPAISWLPPAPDAPTRPYWVTNAQPLLTIPDPLIPDALMEGTTLSLHLESARYDAATKTCTNAACHLAQTQVTWGAPHGYVACGPCHGFN